MKEDQQIQNENSKIDPKKVDNSRTILSNNVTIINNGEKIKQIGFEKTFILGNMSEKDLELRKKENSSNILIPIKDYTLSRYHLKVECINNMLNISDLGSQNGTYLCNPDEIQDYELEIQKEFIVGDTTMIMTKKNNNSSEFCLYVLDGYLSGLEFKCKCNSSNSFYFKNGDLRLQAAQNDFTETLIIFDEEKYKKQRIQVEIKWEEETKKHILVKNEQIGYWIRISNFSFPGTKTKQSEKAVLRLGNQYFVYINCLEQ